MMKNNGTPIPQMVDPGSWRARLRVLLTPSCWLTNDPYDEEWDRALRDLMAKHRFRNRSEYTAHLGPLEIWVANHPFASMSPYRPTASIRPKRITILQAMDKLECECPPPPPAWKRVLMEAEEHQP